MAEYIDREQIKYCRERVLNHWSGSRHTDCDVTYKDIVTKQYINNIPTADVVERERIKQAIEMLDNAYEELDGYDPSSLGIFKDAVNEMFDKLLNGEAKELGEDEMER